ncbi:MAG: IS200/IS605 family accessory protein TnpB-related protein [Candidatus Heimdallarchaeota archaeon]
MRRYQATKRVAFKRLLEGQKRQAIVDQVRALGLLSNARYIRSAIDEAQALIQSQHELVNLYHKEARWRVKTTKKQLNEFRKQLPFHPAKLSSNQWRKLKGLERRQQKAKSKLTYWKTHLKHKTFPKVVFGGKQRFRAYQQGKLTKAEWQHHRNNGLYCVGEKNRKGNNNLRVHYQPTTDSFAFSMLVDGGAKGERLTAPLYVPAPFKGIYQQHPQGVQAYTVKVLIPSTGEHVRVVVTSDHPNPTVPNEQGMAGMDLNPAGIAVTLLYPDGNFRRSKWFPQPELMYASKGKRRWLIGNLIKRVIAWIKSHGINTLAIEDLRFSKRYGASKKFNRVKTNFVYRQLLTTIQAQALKKGLAVKEVNPAFTSIIGEWKYARMYGLNGHQAAALVIGRRGLGLSEKLHGHVHHSVVRLVVPPMEGWFSKQITAFTRDIAGFTARLGTPTAFKSRGSSPTTSGRRQGSEGGIVPRKHTPTPGTGALVCSKEQPVLSTTT